jgi:VCBS repeat protein/Big-like domain-containing protein
MWGMGQAQATSPGSWAVAHGFVRRPLARLALLAGAVITLAAWGTPAHAVTFSAPTAFGVQNAPQSIAVADFNGDSDPDMAVVNEFSHNISVLTGGAGGSFSGAGDYGVGQRPLWVASGDFNGDSDPDLAVVNEGTDDLSVLLGGAGASFSGPTNFAVAGACIPPASCPSPKPQAVAVGKFDGDSDPDLAVVNEATNSVSVLLGGSGGSFGAPTSFGVNSTPRSIVVGKFDSDSDLDLAVANEGSNDVSVLLGGTGGSFTGPVNFLVGSKPTSITMGEFNGDSDPDLAVANELDHNVSVLLGGAGGSFGGATNFSCPVSVACDLPDTVVVGEFNGDSDPDLAVANQGSANVSLLFGGPAGSFVGPTNFAAGQKPTAVVVADFNGDSHADLAVANEDGATYQTSAGIVAVLLATPPETTLDSGPAGLTNDSTPTFTFSSNDSSSTFQCRINSGAFASCSAPHTRSVLPDGDYTFEVRATDDAGRTDPTPAGRLFTIDTVPPTIPNVIGTTPGSPANDNNPRVRGAAAANSTVRLYTTIDCSGSPAATGSAAEFAAPGLQATVPNNSTTRFYATAVDQAGNVSACSASSATYVEVSPPDETPAPPGGGPPAGGGGGGLPPVVGLPVGGVVGVPGAGTPLGGVAAPDRTGPVMVVVSKAVKLDSRGAFAVPISCPASEQVCEGIFSIETLVQVGAGRAAARKRKVTLGRSAFRIPGGQSLRVKVRLSKRNLRLIRKLRKVRVLAIINARDQAGNAQTTRQTLILKAAAVTSKR